MGFTVRCDTCYHEESDRTGMMPTFSYCENCGAELCDECGPIISGHGIFCDEDCESKCKEDNTDEEE